MKIENLFCKMRELDRALDGNGTFRFNAGIDSNGTMSVFLWSKDYKETYLTYHFNDIEHEAEMQEALAALAYIEGYVKGYAAAEIKAQEVEFGPLETVEPVKVEAA
jgi:hypothetical protein